MAYVEMKCPNCGAPMNGDGNRFVCSHCGTSVLNVIDAKIDSDVTVMSAQEFTEKLEASKKSFVININNRLEEFDVDTMVINKKIKDAEAYLADGRYYDAEMVLRYVPRDKYFSVERLIYLASKEVRNEFDLTDYASDIRDDKYPRSLPQYDRMIALADDETKKTYEKIREYCLEKQKVKAEIDEIEKLFAVGLDNEAVTYAKKMCQTYPQAARTWQTLYNAKRRIDPDYVGKDEFEKAKNCPDYLGNPLTAIAECDGEQAEKNKKNDEKLRKRAEMKASLKNAIVITVTITVVLLAAIIFSVCSFMNSHRSVYISTGGWSVILEIIAICVGQWQIRERKEDFDNEKKKELIDCSEKVYIKRFFDVL